MSFIYVFIGGGLGSMARYGIAKALQSYTLDFPWATFITNFLACIILGALTAHTGKNVIPESMKFTLMIGFCGGFSTFSTFSNETFKLFEQGNFTYAILNILISVLVCLFGIYLGFRLMK